MKNLRILFMLLIATVAGLSAVMLASRWLLQQGSNGITKVAVAAADISLGQQITPEAVKLVDWPAASLPPGVVQDAASLAGRVTKASLSRGEPVLESKLTPVGTKGGLSAVIANGKRAITVRVNDVVGVAGFALPGSFVDIIVNTAPDSKAFRNSLDELNRFARINKLPTELRKRMLEYLIKTKHVQLVESYGRVYGLVGRNGVGKCAPVRSLPRRSSFTRVY